MRTTVPLGQEPVGLSVSLLEIHSCGTQNRRLPTVPLKPALSGRPDRGDGGEAARSEHGHTVTSLAPPTRSLPRHARARQPAAAPPPLTRHWQWHWHPHQISHASPDFHYEHNTNDMSDTAAGWFRTNLGIAATIIALAGTILGGVAAAGTWLASVHHLERRVDVLRSEVNAMRGVMDEIGVLSGTSGVSWRQRTRL